MNKIQRNNVNNNPKPVATEEAPVYQGSSATRINENYTFGEKAQMAIKMRYEHLGPAKVTLSLNKEHPHPYAAFCRKHFDNIIVNGMAKGRPIVDVGGHAIRTSVTTESGTSWSKRVHSMLPILGHRDKIRHNNWENMFLTAGKTWTPKDDLDLCKGPMENSCYHVADESGLCPCVDANGKRIADNAVLKSIDSAYYPGVLTGIMAEMEKHRNPVAYLAFHDYSKAYRDGKMDYMTLDEEAHVEFSKKGGYVYVKSTVRGNPEPYEHKVINVPAETWVVRKGTNSFVFEVVNRLTQGCHDYILVQAMKVDELFETIPHSQEVFVVYNREEELKEEGEEIQRKLLGRIVEGTIQLTKHCYNLPEATRKIVKSYMKSFKNACVNDGPDRKKPYEIYDSTEEGVLVMVADIKMQGIQAKERWHVKPALVASAAVDLLGKYDNSSIDRVVKKLYVDQVRLDSTNFDLTYIQDSVMFASWLNSTMMSALYVQNNNNDSVYVAKVLQKGLEMPTEWFGWMKNYSVFTRKGRLGLLAAKYLEKMNALKWYIITLWFVAWMFDMLPGARAVGSTTVTDRSNFELVFFSTIVVPLFVVLLEASAMVVINASTRMWLKGTCVVDTARLDIDTTIGRRHDPKWKFKDADWNILGLTAEQAFDKLICKKCDSVEAGQIGPIIRGLNNYTPTVKHVCPRTKMAAAIRACQSNLRPDPEVFKMVKLEYKKLISRVVTGMWNEAGIHIDLDQWLQKYPLTYQGKMIEQMNKPDHLVAQEPWYVYDAFPKRELQFTTVIHDLKDTFFNDVKERQICGPSAEKKIAANAFCNIMEEISDKHIEEYCGRSNWPQICAKIFKAMQTITDPVFLMLDGSGFDMNVSKCYQKMTTKGMEEILSHDDLITYDVRITKKDIVDAFKASEEVKVQIDQGVVSYESDSRQSGDGWTTLVNTWIMIVLNKLVFRIAGVPKSQRFLLVKGDDVLIIVSRKYKQAVQMALDQLFAKNKETHTFGVGQIMKYARWADTIEEMDFLSNRFFITKTGIRMVRIPARVLQTLPWSTKIKVGERGLDAHSRELLFSKGKCLLAWAEGLPIFDPLARKLISLGKEGTRTEFNQYSDGGRFWAPDDDSCEFKSWLINQFGLTLLEIEQIERAISCISDQFDEVIIPCLDKFYV